MEGISVIPYCEQDGIRTFKDSELREIFNRFYLDGIGDQIFHDGSISSADHFVEIMKSRGTFLFVAMDKEELIGIAWFNRIERTHCHGHFGFYKSAWGTGKPLEAGKKILEVMLQTFPLIMGVIPLWNSRAINFLKKLGFKVVGSVPNLVWHDLEKTSCTGTLVRLTGENFNASL